MSNYKKTVMKRILLFTFAIFYLNTAFIMAQKCNLQGIVRYKYNEYLEYKIDVGAEIRIIEVHEAKAVIRTLWQKYDKLASIMVNYLSLKKKSSTDDDTIRKLTGFSKERETELNELSAKCYEQYIDNWLIAPYMGVIDSSGRYSIELPYGSYFVFVQSANRTRPSISEQAGRLILERVTIDKPTQILSFDFEY